MSEDRPSDKLPRHLDPRANQHARHSPHHVAGRHLTDRPLPPSLDPRRGPGGRGRHGAALGKTRSGPLALTGKVVAVVVSVTILISSGIMWATTGRNLHPDTIAALPTDDGAGGQAAPDKDGTSQNILVVGNDSRAGLTKKELNQVGTDANQGLDTDTILLVHLPADGSKATVVSFPRDSYVDIPGYKKNKINAAYADGACLPPGQPERDCGGELSKQARGQGAQQLIRTVSALTDLHIDHYVEVSLLGFYTISNALGGVDVCLARRWYDPEHEKGIDVPPGNVKLKGKLALAFVRERYTLPNGDLDRIRRQQAFIGALVRKLLSAGTLLNPLKVNRLVQAVSDSLTLDSKLKPFDLIDQMRNVAAGNVTFTTIPTGAAQTTPDGKSVLNVDPAKVQRFIDTVIGAPAPTPSSGGGSSPSAASPSTAAVPPSSVAVAVQNGTTKQNLAATTRSQLLGAGFRVSSATNADRQDYGQTTIEYGTDGAAAAQTLAAAVPGATTQPNSAVSSGVRLILGANFDGVRSAASTGRPSSAAGSAPAADGGSASPRPSGSSSPTPKIEKRTASSTSCVN